LWRFCKFTMLCLFLTGAILGCKNNPAEPPLVVVQLPEITKEDIGTPRSEDPVPVPDKPPVATDPPPSNKPISLQLADSNLELTLVETEQGFRLDYTKSFGTHIMQTLATPRGDAIVHVIRRTHSSAIEETFRKELIVVEPDEKKFHIHTLMNGQTTDSYATDTLTNIFGFMDEEHIVYAAVHGKPGTRTTYNIEKLNVYTGEKEVLFENEPDNVSPDFYMPGWLNDNRDRLFINSFSKGKAWVYDLLDRKAVLLEQRFESSWPYFAVLRSPDGERFWYHGKLYDLYGQLIADPESVGNVQLNSFWSPDSQFSARHYAYETGIEHSMDGGEGDIIGPQGLVVMDRTGKIVHQIETEDSLDHLELAGWIPDKQIAVLQYYEIDRSQPTNDQKTKVTYKTLNLLTGEIKRLAYIKLEQLNVLDRVMTWSWRSPHDWPFFVDLDSNTYWRSPERATYLGQLSGGEHVWRTNDYGKGVSTIYSFSTSTRETTILDEEHTLLDINLYMNRWLVDPGNLNYKRVY
jgi:hypothetical protein